MRIVRNPQLVPAFAWLAITGQVILLASAWLLPLVSEYGFVDDTISELALGRLGAVQTAAFAISGIGTLGLAVAIRRSTTGLRGSPVGSLLVAVYGAGGILSGIFPTDRVDDSADLSTLSATGGIHVAVAIVSFVAVIIGMYVLTWTFMQDPRRPAAWWWMLFPAAAVSLLLAQASETLAGLMQRLLVLVIAGWLVLAAARILSLTAGRRGEASLASPTELSIR